MRKIVIFSGTTEGRLLSEGLSARQCAHIVCVATEYGKEMMKENPWAELHTGRLDAEEMKIFLQEQGMDESGIVIDATHPYAEEVSRNIRSAVRESGCAYRRILRDPADTPDAAVECYDDMAGCARALERTEGRILLTTGSKELPVYCDNVSDETKQRTWVRILPSEESLERCLSAGISADHILAMQGPFSAEFNLAMLRQYRIDHLVTKESGRAGGFEEKIAAAGCAGVHVHLIARPPEEVQGVTVQEVLRELTGEVLPEITLAGFGMGDPSCVTGAVQEAIAQADIVFGAERLLRGLEVREKYAMYRASEIIPVLEEKKPRKAVILFSGDTGFFSGAKGMRKELRRWKSDAVIRTLPGISSIACLAARLGESYEDACIVSIHGKNSDSEISGLLHKIRLHRRTFVLLSGAEDIRRLAAGLLKEQFAVTVHVGSDLSYDKERVEHLSVEQAADYEGSGVITLMVENPQPEKRPLIPTLRNADLQKGSVPMTKPVVRHESILRLNLKEGDTLYDIGGGTGSVAIEAAMLHPRLKVVTIEKNPEAAALIRENCSKTGMEHVTILEGEASELLRDLERPDCVFIGGTGGKLDAIMDVLCAKGKGIRFVINAVSLETMEQIRKLMDRLHASDAETVQLQVTDVLERGGHHMMQANNPVMICSFTV